MATQLESAVSALIESWDSYTLDDIATKLTCGEAEALANVFRAAGLGGAVAADDLIKFHAEGDEPDDDHYTGSDN